MLMAIIITALCIAGIAWQACQRLGVILAHPPQGRGIGFIQQPMGLPMAQEDLGHVLLWLNYITKHPPTEVGQ